MAPPNDLPANAIDVSAGGMFAFDLSNALSNSTPVCAGAAGPDVYHQLTLTAAEVVYFDTLASAATTYDNVLQVRNAANVSVACIDDASCGGSAVLSTAITGPGLFWAIVDGCGACGAYKMSYSL